ncbi:MAG: isochorismatase family protein, partial [Hyphomicrobium sp.]|nr:isochorismatase family protein [Hyphomicrobium sp.]
VGLLNGATKHDLPSVIDRINSLSSMIRKGGGKVVWIRHCGKVNDGFERGTPGWEFLPELGRHDDDLVVEKTLNDPYVGTPLAELLARMRPRRVLVAGWATDFCVDATVRSTVSHDHHVVAVSDAHTLSDRPHLPAKAIIAHHNWLWSDLLTNRTCHRSLDKRAPRRVARLQVLQDGRCGSETLAGNHAEEDLIRILSSSRPVTPASAHAHLSL